MHDCRFRHSTVPCYCGRLCRWPEEGRHDSSPLTQTSCYTRIPWACVVSLRPRRPLMAQDLLLPWPLPLPPPVIHENAHRTHTNVTCLAWIGVVKRKRH